MVSATPANNATGVPTNANLVVTFDQDISASGTLGQAEVNLVAVNNPTNTIGRSATLSADGKTLTVDPNPTLAPGTQYRLSLNGTIVGSNAGIRSADGNRLVNTTITFTTTSDITPPTVTLTNPAAGEIGVGRTPAVRFTASEPVIGVTTGAGGTFNIQVLSTGAPVAATLTSNASGSVWTLAPNAALSALTTYKVTVTGGATGVRDAAGNPLTGNTGAGSTTFTWTFQTR